MESNNASSLDGDSLGPRPRSFSLHRNNSMPTLPTSSESENHSHRIVCCQANDVLLGRGNIRWEGNQRFQDVIRENAARYNEARSRSEKTQITFEIVGAVRAWGGRFLQPAKSIPFKSAIEKANSLSSIDKKYRKEGTLWTIADTFQIRKKIGQALRYNMTGEQNKTKATLEEEASPSHAQHRKSSATTGSSGSKRKERARTKKAEKEEEDSKQSSSISDDGSDSVGDLDVIVLMDFFGSDSNDRLDHEEEDEAADNKRRKRGESAGHLKQPPLVPSGYDAGRFLPQPQHDAVCTNINYTELAAANYMRVHRDQHSELQLGFSTTNYGGHMMGSGGIAFGPGSFVRSDAALVTAEDVDRQRHREDHENNSMSSIDVSLTAIVHVEQEEEEEQIRRLSGQEDDPYFPTNIFPTNSQQQQPPLLTDFEILSFLEHVDLPTGDNGQEPRDGNEDMPHNWWNYNHSG
ncbi:hypothetical protein ACA910_007641 [Epithemia clementina (nom. ined.)]